jgi:N6-L-threonylcarbamoyladenine synthase
MIILSIESSCDETSVSISEDGHRVLSNIVLTQIDVHSDYGGVVPEIASREHVKGIIYVFEKALKEAGINTKDIDVVAVTKGPGLIGSLLIGVNAAKAFAYAHQIPIIGIHHIAGHIYANQIKKNFEFPALCLVVSGGHTELVLMKGHYQFKKLGQTLDDAVGESYDKVARVLGLGYPGGPKIDRLAQEGSPNYKMPSIKDDDSYDFSYSGLKSHMINLVHNANQKNELINIPDLCASFQAAAMDILIKKAKKAVKEYSVKMFMVAGGVAANSYLRQKINESFNDIEVVIPEMEYCMDNAAMIGIAAFYQLSVSNQMDDLTLNGFSRLNLEG